MEQDKKNSFEEAPEILQRLSVQFEKSKLGAYVDLMQKPIRMIYLNFFAGLARGFGFAMGFAILGAVVLYLVERLVVLNIPVIGGVVTEIVKLVKLNVK